MKYILTFVVLFLCVRFLVNFFVVQIKRVDTEPGGQGMKCTCTCLQRYRIFSFLVLCYKVLSDIVVCDLWVSLLYIVDFCD